MNLKNNLKYTLLAITGWALSAGMVQAQEPAAEPAKPPGWETSAAAGLTLTRGNSDTLLVTLSLDTKRKWERDEALAGISGGYGEIGSSKNAEFLKGYGQYNRLFNERLYGGLRLDANYDGIANLDYRATLSPMIGYYLIKNPKTSLAVEAGPSLVLEKFRGQNADTYLAARFAERFEHKLTETTKVWQSLEYMPRVDRWTEKYIITAEVGIDTAITKKWSLRVVAQDIYDSEPAPGREENDLRIIAGTAYQF